MMRSTDDKRTRRYKDTMTRVNLKKTYNKAYSTTTRNFDLIKAFLIRKIRPIRLIFRSHELENEFWN